MLEVSNLSVNYYPQRRVVQAVEAVSFSLAKGEILGLVGESGSGKSTIALAIMRLLSSPGEVANGEINYNGQNLLKLTEAEMIKIRGAQISMIFQDPFTSLNPVITIGEQIAEALKLHQGLNNKEAWQKAIEMLALVQINDPVKRAKDFPHQFSGGMRQRAMIAMALACRPALLIADEPTTALDVTVQAEIIKLLQQLQRDLALSIIYITHNFGIVKALCNRVLVMYQGKIVEQGKTLEVIESPKEEYTKRLINCLRELKK